MRAGQPTLRALGLIGLLLVAGTVSADHARTHVDERSRLVAGGHEAGGGADCSPSAARENTTANGTDAIAVEPAGPTAGVQGCQAAVVADPGRCVARLGNLCIEIT